MTQKDYRMIAKGIKIELDKIIYDDKPYEKAAFRCTLYSLMHYLQDNLELDNPRFDRHKFEAACGFEA